MSRFSYLLRGAIGLGAIVGIAACGDADTMVLGPVTPTGGAIFKTYVSMGNSITAGWQSDGLNDSTQRASYANLFAIQAGTRFAYPSMTKPGCPVLTGNWVNGKKIDSLAPVPGGCALRDPTKATAILNNVAVPYAWATDVTQNASGGYIIPGNSLNTLILGGMAQVDRAIIADPTFISIWFGNNETLAPASVGMMGGLPGSAPPLIPASIFIPAIKKAIDSVVAASPHLQGGILIGATRVANTPRFWSADSLINATKRGTIDTYTGRGPSAVIACGTTVTGWLVSTEMVKRLKVDPTLPNVFSCVANTPAAPIGDLFMLDPTEQATLNATTDAYNVYIKAKADTLHWAYLDPNLILAPLRTGAAPTVPAFPNFTSNTRDAATSVFGALFSLDGVHPSAAGQKLIANAMIDSVNSKYGTKLIKVP